ncbi:MAG: hypothetical protein PUJ51_19870 [Clostridiales bacterium]|nr:hypothetical protein [Clostridiales bacterium]
MDYKEKIKFKKEIFEELLDCMVLDLHDSHYVVRLDKGNLKKKIEKYTNELEGIKNYERNSH